MRTASSLLIAGVALALAGCDRPAEHAQARAQPARPAGRIVVLPDSAIVVKQGSTEEQLARFLASDLPAPRTFRFTGPEFEPWASRPNETTLRTMYAVVQILRAYPKAMVTLAGYTDNDGSVEDNRKLAQERVDRLEEMLVRGGIARPRIAKEAHAKEGYVASNVDEAGRARNRRIELTVTAK